MPHLGEELDHVPEHPAPGVQLGVELQQPGVLPGQHVVQRDVRVYAGLAWSTWLLGFIILTSVPMIITWVWNSLMMGTLAEVMATTFFTPAMRFTFSLKKYS